MLVCPGVWRNTGGGLCPNAPPTIRGWRWLLNICFYVGEKTGHPRKLNTEALLLFFLTVGRGGRQQAKSKRAGKWDFI